MLVVCLLRTYRGMYRELSMTYSAFIVASLHSRHSCSFTTKQSCSREGEGVVKGRRIHHDTERCTGCGQLVECLVLRQFDTMTLDATHAFPDDALDYMPP